jgi:hypothetical protein
MAIHQLDLHPKKPSNRSTDAGRAAAYAKGQSDLFTALALDEDLLELIRGQARALYQTQRYDECKDVILGLLTLGDARPEYANMMVTCAEAAQDFMAAADWRAAAAGSWMTVEAQLPLETK